MVSYNMSEAFLGTLNSANIPNNKGKSTDAPTYRMMSKKM